MVVYCDCPCHKPGATILHFDACCSLCPKCGKGIVRGFKEHFGTCTGELLNKVKRKRRQKPEPPWV